MSYHKEDMVRIRALLEQDPAAKWGFVIYRCTYENEDEWARFMDYLNTRTRLNLEEGGDEDLFERIDWQVQEDRVKFIGATKYDLRRHFNSEVRPAMKQQPNTPRHDHFLVVDQSDVSRVLYKACPANEFDAMSRGFLYLVSNDDYEGCKLVGVAYIMPSVYSLIDMRGWESLIESDDDSDVWP